MNVEKYGTAGQATEGNVTRRMRIACWINSPTDWHSEYVQRIAFPRQQWLCEPASLFCLFLVVRIATSVLKMVKHHLTTTYDMIAKSQSVSTVCWSTCSDTHTHTRQHTPARLRTARMAYSLAWLTPSLLSDALSLPLPITLHYTTFFNCSTTFHFVADNSI